MSAPTRYVPPFCLSDHPACIPSSGLVLYSCRFHAFEDLASQSIVNFASSLLSIASLLVHSRPRFDLYLKSVRLAIFDMLEAPCPSEMVLMFETCSSPLQ